LGASVARVLRIIKFGRCHRDKRLKRCSLGFLVAHLALDGRNAVIGFRAETGVSPALSDWLDLARGLAAVEVLAFHSYQLMFMERLPGPDYDPAIRFVYSVFWALSAHGGDAVMVFFVLSGYLVGGPALVRCLSGRLSAVDYFSARIARLYIVVIPALTISFCAYISARQSPGWEGFVVSHQALYESARVFFAPTGAGAAICAICNGLFLQTIACSEFAGNVALWSLSNEFWYYVLFFALISARKTPAYALLIIAIFGLFLVAERLDASGTHIGLKFFFFFAIWCCGVLVYAVAAPAWVWCCGFLASLAGVYVLSAKGLFPHWAAVVVAVGLGSAAFILCIDHLKIRLPSFLRFGRELARFSFSLYAIHYPILLLLNVTASGRQDFTLASLGLDASFILFCLLLAGVFYLLFESRTPVARVWLKAVMLRGIDGGDRTLRHATITETAKSNYTLARDHRTAAAQYPGGMPDWRSAASTASPSQGCSLPEDKPRERSGSTVPQVALNDGHRLPQLGFGVWQIDNASAPEIIGTAINAGYRLIDTAANYGNEAGVGQAIKRAIVPRNEIFVTTKLRNEAHGYDQTMRAFDLSAANLRLDVIDLYLIHWPCPQRTAYVDTWRAFIELKKQGRIRSIGVSNFTAENLERIIGETGVVPVLNQVELHPTFQQRSLRNVHEDYGIVTQAWSPLGQGSSLADPRLQAIASRYGRSPAQVVLRWHVENGFIAIPKSAVPDRIAENIDLFNFELTTSDHAVIAGLDRPDGRMGPDPAVHGQMRFARRLMRRVSGGLIRSR
jgi:diketogulonate reductase-like aldo/keto reductase/peptidoglycan/LPS O-acetylase OafA/YrhL